METYSKLSDNETLTMEMLMEVFGHYPIPRSEMLGNLGVFVIRKVLSRILFFNELYKRIVETHGVIAEFGVRWGRDLTILQSLRGIYEPYNYSRKIIGFDSFKGFSDIDEKDGKGELMKEGSFSVHLSADRILDKILSLHEDLSPLAHIKKYELVSGDIILTLDNYFKKHPETIIALAYFDLDLYKPTKKCLELLKNHMPRGSIMAFDELSHPDFPGETLALQEFISLEKLKIQRFPFSSYSSYVVLD